MAESDRELERVAEAIFHDALDARESERDRLLDDRCGGDPRLRARVEELLRHFAGADSGFLDVSPVDRMLAASELHAGDVVGGRYRLVAPVGEGGLAVVWKARQSSPIGRDVAIKVLKPGMDSRQMLARFALERETLGRLQHPGIAVIHDAGATERGSPFVAMELVEGRHLVRFCDEERLDLRARAELFIDVCEAVRHAHERGIIHRDLKPSNILAWREGGTPDGRPKAKVIDFGIARALDRTGGEGRSVSTSPGTSVTAPATGAGQAIGTPEYMSPEQAAGDLDAISTATDVYALGVVLYELLAGILPSRAAGVDLHSPVHRAAWVRTNDFPRPSTGLRLVGSAARALAAARATDVERLRRSLRGEFDWIVMKAIEAEPARRYATVQMFAEDVRRALDGEAVVAGPPGSAYRLRRFLGRNRALAIASALVAMALLVGLVGTSFGLVRARQAEALALRTAYASSIAAGARAADAGDGPAARRALEMAPAALRDWEWRHLAARVGGGGIIDLAAHEGEANMAVFLPGDQDDQATILTVGADGAIRRWEVDLVGGSVGATRTLHEVGEPLVMIAVSRDGEAALAATEKGALLLFDLVEERERWRAPIGAYASSECFSPDGTTIACATREGPTGRLLLLDRASGAILASERLPHGWANATSFAADGRSIWWGTYYEPHVGSFAIDRGEDGVVRLSSPRHARVEGGVTLASPDAVLGRVAGFGEEHPFLLDLAAGPIDGGEFRRLEGSSIVVDGKRATLATSRDGTAVAVGDVTGALWLWRIAEGSASRLSSEPSSIRAIAFSPNSRHLAVASTDGHVRVLTDPGGRAGLVVRRADVWGTFAAAIAPDGSAVASGGWGVVRAWDVRTGIPLWTRTIARGNVRSLGIARTGRIVGSTDRDELLVLDPTTGDREAWSLDHVDAREIAVASFQPERDALVLRSGDGRLSMVDLESGVTIRTLEGRWSRLFDAGFGRVLAIPSDGSALVDVVDGSRTPLIGASGSFDVGRVAAAIRLPQGDLVVGTTDGQVLRLDREGQAVWSRAVSGSAAAPLAVHPSGSRIALAGQGGSAIVLDATDGETLLQVRLGVSAPQALRFVGDDGFIGVTEERPIIALGEADEPTRAARHATSRVGTSVRALTRALQPNARAVDAIASGKGWSAVEGEPPPFPLDDLRSHEIRATALAIARGLGDFGNGLNSDAILIGGDAGRDRDQYEHALALSDAAIAAAPDRANYFLVRALLLARLGRHDDAADALRRATVLSGAEEDEPLLAAFLALRRGDLPAVRRFLDGLDERAETSADSLARLLIGELRQGVREAISEI